MKSNKKARSSLIFFLILFFVLQNLIVPKYKVSAYHNGYNITYYLSNPGYYAGQSLCNNCVYVSPYQNWGGYTVTLSPNANYYVIATVLVNNYDLYINCNGGQAYIDCGFNETEYFNGYTNWFLEQAPDSGKHDGGYRSISMFNVINDHWLTFDNVSVNANGSKETDTCVFVGATDGSTGGKLNVKGSASLMNALYGDFATCKSTVLCSNYVGNRINHGTAHIGQLGWGNTSSNQEVTAHTTAQGECSGSSGYYTCNGCGAQTGTWDTRKSHDFSSKTTTNVYLRSNATCTSAATYYYKCSGCSAKGSSYYSFGNALGHISNSTWVNSKTPTCTIAGEKHTNCSRCGTNMNSTTIPALGHDFVWIKDTDPNCELNGYKHQRCNRCGYEDSFNTPYAEPLGHTPETHVIEPTCTKEGVSKEICSTCGAELSATPISALGHIWTYNNSYISTKPTVYQTGIRTFVCERDGTHICDKVEPALQFSIFTGKGQTKKIYIGDNLISVPQSLKSSGIADLPTE